MLCYLFVDGRYFQKALDNMSSEFFGGEKLPVDYGNFALVLYQSILLRLSPLRKAQTSLKSITKKSLRDNRSSFVNFTYYMVGMSLRG